MYSLEESVIRTADTHDNESEGKASDSAVRVINHARHGGDDENDVSH